VSVLLETKHRRLFSPEKVFSGHCAHPCYGDCGNVMVVPNEMNGALEQLQEGDIWACSQCGTKHEYYMAYAGGSRWATIRILEGKHERTSAEPGILEFVL
jgi:hypothetical protein